METKTIKKVIYPIILLLLSACYNINESNTPIPENFFNKEKMVDVLMDIQIIEGTLIYNRVNNKDGKELKEEYYNQVFLEYNITALDFKQNMDYYTSKPKLMEEVLDNVLENLNERQAKLEQKIANEKVIEDSLRLIYTQDSIKIADSIQQIKNKNLSVNN